MCVRSPLPLEAGALCHDNVCTTRQGHTQRIPMETLKIKLSFLLAFCWGVVLESHDPLEFSGLSGVQLTAQTMHRDWEGLHRDVINAAKSVRKTPKRRGKSEEQLPMHCRVSWAAQAELSKPLIEQSPSTNMI